MTLKQEDENSLFWRALGLAVLVKDVKSRGELSERARNLSGNFVGRWGEIRVGKLDKLDLYSTGTISAAAEFCGPLPKLTLLANVFYFF